MNKPNNSWEIEFYKEFPSLSVIEGQGDEGSIHGYDAKPYVKDFITKTLQQQREEDIKEVIKYIRDGNVSGSFSEGCRCSKCNSFEKKVRHELLQNLKQEKF